MRSFEADPQHVELTNEIVEGGGVRFDPETITLLGWYEDELSAWRARKGWSEVFENTFLLDSGHDFALGILESTADGRFLLSCTFMTACARYAFWRLTNHQAPEAQYLIETAHIPHCDSRHDDLLRAPDLRPLVCEDEEEEYRSCWLESPLPPRTLWMRIRRFFSRS